MVVKVMQDVMYGAFGGEKFLLTGPTGAGKTTYASKLATPKATPLLSQMIGKGNCTLTPKTFVFSEEPELHNHIRLCAKPNSQPLQRTDFDEVIMDAFGSLAKQAAKENVKHVENAEDLLVKGFIKGDNHVSFLGLLKEDATLWIAKTAEIMEQVDRDELRVLHEIARSRVEDPEAAKSKSKSTESMDKKLSEVFREYLEGSLPELSNQEIGRELTNQYIQINALFFTLSTAFFNDSEVTADGYLTLAFPLEDTFDEQLEEKKQAFFSDNSSEHKISMEVLYEEIVVYVGINLGIVKQLGEDGNKFRNRNGYVEFGLIDTMGAFHRYGDKGDAKDYLTTLSRSHDYDGMIILIPLVLEANEKKFVQLSRDFFRQFPYDLDVVIISNKVDRFIDQFKKEWKSKNFSLDPFADAFDTQDQDVDTESLKKQLVNTLHLIKEEFTETVEKEGNGRVHILGHYTTSFVENRYDTMELEQLSLLPQAILETIRAFAKSKKSINKVEVGLDDSYGSDIGIRFNHNCLKQGIQNVLPSSLFASIIQNCQVNQFKRPHGNSFNALSFKLRYAEGHKVLLHDRFVRVHSFDLNFPGAIRNTLNAIEKDLLTVVRDSITFEGVRHLTDELKDSLINRLAKRISTQNMAVDLVYNQTFKPVMSLPLYSFGAKFQSYIKNVSQKLTYAQQCQAYTDAVEQEVRRAFKITLDKDVQYLR